MVLEVAILDVKTGQNADFVAAFAQSDPLIPSFPAPFHINSDIAESSHSAP